MDQSRQEVFVVSLSLQSENEACRITFLTNKTEVGVRWRRLLFLLITVKAYP